MIFGLSTGCVYKILNVNEIVSFYRKNFDFLINGVELNFCDEDLRKLKFNKWDLDWLKSLDYLSFHLNESKKSYKRIFNFVKKNKLNIKYFVCHINRKEEIPDFFKKEFFDKIIFENLENDDQNFFDHEYKICFDYSHALKCGNEFMCDFLFLNEFGIKQVHLSNINNGECHKFFYKDEFYQLKNLSLFIDKNLNKNPIILECVCENLDELKKEVLFLRNRIN